MDVVVIRARLGKLSISVNCFTYSLPFLPASSSMSSTSYLTASKVILTNKKLLINYSSLGVRMFSELKFHEFIPTAFFALFELFVGIYF